MMHPACGPSIRPSPSDGQETVSRDGTPHASTSTSKLQPCSRAAVSSEQCRVGLLVSSSLSLSVSDRSIEASKRPTTASTGSGVGAFRGATNAPALHMLVGDRDKRIRASRFTAADRDAAGSRLGGPIFIPGSWVIRMTDQDRPGSGASRAKSVAANNALRREGTVESHEPQEESSDPLRELHRRARAAVTPNG
jgi:hypothetical protein